MAGKSRGRLGTPCPVCSLEKQLDLIAASVWAFTIEQHLQGILPCPSLTAGAETAASLLGASLPDPAEPQMTIHLIRQILHCVGRQVARHWHVFLQGNCLAISNATAGCSFGSCLQAAQLSGLPAHERTSSFVLLAAFGLGFANDSPTFSKMPFGNSDASETDHKLAVEHVVPASAVPIQGWLILQDCQPIPAFLEALPCV